MAKKQQRKHIPNPKGNPNIAKAGKETQFKEGNIPAPKNESTISKWDIRAQLKYLMAQDIDPSKLKAEIVRLQKDPANKSAPIARAQAFEMLLDMADKKVRNPALYNTIIENVCGKLTQEIVIPSIKPAPTSFNNLEEAQAAYLENMKS